MKTRRKTKTSSYPPSNTPAGKKSALQKARSALKKAEGAHTPNSIKKKVMSKQGKK